MARSFCTLGWEEIKVGPVPGGCERQGVRLPVPSLCINPSLFCQHRWRLCELHLFQQGSQKPRRAFGALGPQELLGLHCVCLE